MILKSFTYLYQYKYFKPSEKRGYGLISEAKITGNLDEAEDEAEPSPLIKKYHYI